MACADALWVVQTIVRGYRRAAALAERTVSAGSYHWSPSDSGGGNARGVLSRVYGQTLQQTNKRISWEDQRATTPISPCAPGKRISGGQRLLSHEGDGGFIRSR